MNARPLAITHLAAIALMASSFSSPVLSQGVPPGTTQPGGAGLSGTMSHEDIERLSGDRTRHEDSALEGEKARARSSELANALKLSCDVSEATQVGTRRVTADGKEVEADVFEIACKNGLGYFLVSKGPEGPTGISCLSAEGVRAADAASGKTPDLVCLLPENKDIKAMAGRLMRRAGTACDVRDYRWFGKSAAAHTEYSEVVCDDGGGYLLRTPLPGAHSPPHVMSCQDAARLNLKCRLTNAGPVEKPKVTMQTIRDALAQNGVTCPIDKIRVVGQEDTLKRYVVEYRCAEQSQPLVAFVPLTGNVNPFESMDCATAVTHRVVCEFSPSD